MRNDIHGNHKHLATVVLFHKYKQKGTMDNTDFLSKTILLSIVKSND